MADFEFKGIDDFIEELKQLENLEEIAPKMIDEATPIVKKNMKKYIHEAANRGYATGTLENAVNATKAKVNNYGYFAAVLVRGKDEKGVRNAEKLAYLEYGTGKQTAHPIMEKVVNDSEDDVIKKMQEVFDREK